MRPSSTLKRLALALVLLLAAFGSAQAQTEIRIAIPGEGDTLDPAYMSFVNSFAVATNVYSGLVRYAPGTIDLMPDLATEWAVSDDGLTWTFAIRDDVVWQKGYGKLVAQDIVDSFERVRDPATGSRWQGELAIIESITAPDDTTVVFQLKQPSAAFLHNVAAFRQGLITNARAVAEHGDDYGRNPVGTGAFELVEWVPGVQITLQANPDYYLGKPPIDRATFVVIADESVRMLALQRGEVDIAMNLQNPEVYKTLQAHPNIRTGEIATSSSHGINVNTRMAPFDDVRVRRALMHALDRELIAEVIWGGLAAPAYSDLAPAYLGHTQDVPRYEYDPAKARELLAEAGYPNGFKTTLYWLSTHSTELLGAIRAMWRDVGVDAEPRLVDAGTWVASIGSGEAPLILSLATRVDPHVWYSSFFHSDAFPPGMNGMFYDAVDDLIDAGGVESDPEKRAAIYTQIQQQVMSDLPYLPLYWPKHAHPYWDHVVGWDGRQQYDAWLFPVSLAR
ncbi:MAG: ABC transporter substrate-binding protein [Deinococcales bacterium]|nr:ABC transporter substrate-binding protein [Deinococcales bacterium]